MRFKYRTGDEEVGWKLSYLPMPPLFIPRKVYRGLSLIPLENIQMHPLHLHVMPWPQLPPPSLTYCSNILLMQSTSNLSFPSPLPLSNKEGSYLFTY